VGTVTYMSPERLQGQSYTSDTDLWSLGMTILECIIGQHPFPGVKSFIFQCYFIF